MALRPPAKIGIIVLGLVVALALSWIAVELREKFSQVPAVEKAGGMYAFGDLVVGLAVFGIAALAPLGLALYWLRPVEKFWHWLTGLGVGWALTGFVGLAINHWAEPPMGLWTLLGNIRFGIMPLTALALLSCAAFAPLPRHRWILATVAAVDAAAFAAVVVFKFVLT